MIIDDFIAEERRLLLEFLFYWTRMNQQNPTDYPVDLEYGQWIEQFQIFCETNSDSYKLGKGYDR